MVRHLSFGPATHQIPSSPYILRLVPNTYGFCKKFIDSSERYSLAVESSYWGKQIPTPMSWITNFSPSYVDQCGIFYCNLTYETWPGHTWTWSEIFAQLDLFMDPASSELLGELMNIDGYETGWKDCQRLCTYCAKDSRCVWQSGEVEVTPYTT